MANKAAALDASTTARLLEAEAPAPPRSRVTMTLPYLLRARLLILLIFGQRKLDLLGAPERLPIAALLNQTQSPVRVIWAP